MKKQSQHTNESGFYLPYVLMVSLITLTVISSSILSYQNEMEATYYLLEQIEAETLIQMGSAQFKKEELYKNNDHGKITYELPNGIVYIEYTRQSKQMCSLDFLVETNNDFSFEFRNIINVENN